MILWATLALAKWQLSAMIRGVPRSVMPEVEDCWTDWWAKVVAAR
jgi:hypothetical protein